MYFEDSLKHQGSAIIQTKGGAWIVKKEFTVIIEQDEQGFFIAEVPELAGCHTQAKSLDQLLERTKETIQLCLEVYGRKAPKTHLVGVQKVAV